MGILELSNFVAAIEAGARLLSEQSAVFPFSIKKGDSLIEGAFFIFYLIVSNLKKYFFSQNIKEWIHLFLTLSIYKELFLIFVLNFAPMVLGLAPMVLRLAPMLLIKTCSDGTKTCSDGTKTCSDGTKTCSDGIKTCSDGTKTCSEETKTCSNGTKTCPDGTKTCSDVPTTNSNGTKTWSDGTNTSLIFLQLTPMGLRLDPMVLRWPSTYRQLQCSYN